jgi:hypothetical protein
MSPEHEPEQPLLAAISEFRSAVNRLIDEHKAWALSRGWGAQEAKQVTSEGTEPGAFERPATSAAVIEADPQLTAREVRPMAPPRPRARTEPTAPVVPTPTPGPAPADALTRSTERLRETTPAAEASPATASDDPRQRLDALAKLLDRRLKQTGSPSPKPPTERSASRTPQADGG